jgi:PleD family two-component response regulator
VASVVADRDSPPQRLVALADGALYGAKAAGRNRYVAPVG